MSEFGGLSFPDILEDALNAVARGEAIADIAATYPEHKKELSELLELPAWFTLEQELVRPDKTVLHACLADLPELKLAEPSLTADPPVPERQDSLFAKITFFISGVTHIAKPLLWIILIIFVVTGILLFRQLNS